MSEIKVNSIKGVGSTDAAITINNSDGTCTANLTNKPNRNLIINGAMQVAQRGTSSTTIGYQTVDRFSMSFGGEDEDPTQAQVDLSSSDTPYSSGFRKAFKITNGNQTSTGGSDFMALLYKIEAQDIANSGWNYTDPNSKLTIQFWAKSSVAKTFIISFYAADGTPRQYNHKYTLAANTWTKVTHTIPGSSTLVFDNNNETGLNIEIFQYIGTNLTSGSTVDQWVTYVGSSSTPDDTDDWWTANDATFEITGVQLEVGSVTDFEHRSFAQELALCERYCQIIMDGGDANDSNQHDILGVSYSADNVQVPTPTRTRMRAAPSMTATTGSFYWRCFFSGTSVYMDAVSLDRESPDTVSITFSSPSGGNISQGTTCFIRTNTGSSRIFLTAEL